MSATRRAVSGSLPIAARLGKLAFEFSLEGLMPACESKLGTVLCLFDTLDGTPRLAGLQLIRSFGN